MAGRGHWLAVAWFAAAATAASATPPAPPGAPRTGADFCSNVQQLIAGTTLRTLNTVHTDYAAFQKSKTAIAPLTSHQFVLGEPGTGTPWRVSCKVKTPDHLRSHYGAAAAAETARSCAEVNRATVRRVYQALAAAGQAPQRPEGSWRFDADATTLLGSEWVAPYAFAYGAPDGSVHLFAKSLRVDWDTLWLAWAPERFRGALYCHLAAPEYVRRVALGAAVPARPPD